MSSRLTLSGAARLWGKSRQTLYTDTKAGRLSLGHDDQGRPFIDAAEMRRVYGEPPSRPDGTGDADGQPDGQSAETSALALKDSEIRRLEDTVALVREQMALLREQNAVLLEQLAQAHKDKAVQAEAHRAAFRLIEHQRPPPAVERRPTGLLGLFRRGA
jgi:hypothetical protein